jgi:hypothetical protein
MQTAGGCAPHEANGQGNARWLLPNRAHRSSFRTTAMRRAQGRGRKGEGLAVVRPDSGLRVAAAGDGWGLACRKQTDRKAMGEGKSAVLVVNSCWHAWKGQRERNVKRGGHLNGWCGRSGSARKKRLGIRWCVRECSHARVPVAGVACRVKWPPSLSVCVHSPPVGWQGQARRSHRTGGGSGGRSRAGRRCCSARPAHGVPSCLKGQTLRAGPWCRRGRWCTAPLNCCGAAS